MLEKEKKILLGWLGCSLGPLVSEDGGGYHTGPGRTVSLDASVGKAKYCPAFWLFLTATVSDIHPEPSLYLWV